MKYFNIGKETEELEFKRSTGELKEGVISIVSILNKHGKGKLYFGVDNNGDVIGQQIGKDTLREVSQAIGNHIRPVIYPGVEKETFGEKETVAVTFEGSQQPYLAYHIPRIRVADEDLVMDQLTYEHLMLQRDKPYLSWEKQLSKYTINDINKEVFKGYLKRARDAGRIGFESDDEKYILNKLELAEGDTLLNAGAALFVDSGINELQMAKFASDERLTFTDIRKYTGSIFELADKAVQYIVDAMDWRVDFEGRLARKEIPEIPIDAIREAVINAFGHRRIESEQSVEVAVFRSFIEIYSHGSFPENMQPEMFIKESMRSIRRNPLITRTLYYSKDMESFATGLKRIQTLCDEIGCKVEFLYDYYGFTVRFYRHCGDGWKKLLDKNENVTLFNEPDPKSNEPNRKSNEPNPESNEPNCESNEPNREFNEPNHESNESNRESNESNRESNEPNREFNESNHESNEPNHESIEPNRESNEPNRKFNEPNPEFIESNPINCLTDLQKSILLIAELDPKISQRKIAEKLCKARITVRREIDELVKMGYISRENGTRGFWKVNKKD
ncbi:MAG: putative DNA binding domain-containing protein [Faecalicoccus sp.]|nr:putative DNA binding domain-containing protein [Faecalicoccus sp.]